MAKQQFKAESKKLLDLMINSIYTHKEIFLREIISNASDALDKLCYISLTDDKLNLKRSDFKIKIKTDKENRLLIISDNGVGMTEAELKENLGTIAKSGSLQFKKDMGEEKEGTDIIGQFGVGFYSAFMVADNVKVITKAYNSDKAYIWESDGTDGYTVGDAEKETVGTDIIMHIKEDTDDEKYSEFLETYKIESLIKNYSDYVHFPITMDIEKSKEVKPRDGENPPEFETYVEEETLNSMVPIWQKSKSEATDEECAKFYKEKFYDPNDPSLTIRVSAEGLVTYKAMLFVPSKTPFGYYTKDFEKGLSLYSSGVLIMDKCADLLPEHFRFVKGVVDSPSLSLNISRELLQHDRQLKVIATNIEKKIKAELLKQLKGDFEKYKDFYKEFGLQLKYGVVNDFGTHKELLRDLLLFYSSSKMDMTTIADYVSRMKEDQKFIYYACGETTTKIDKLPQTELVKDKGYEMLYLTDEVDEFVVTMLDEYEGKKFKSINASDAELDANVDKEKIEKQSEDFKDVLTFVKESLGEKISNVIISQKLKSHPVCLSSESPVSLEMEKYFGTIPGENKVKAQRVLELNAEHPVFKTLTGYVKDDKLKAEKLSEILYNQALLIADLPIEDPSKFAELVCEFIK